MSTSSIFSIEGPGNCPDHVRESILANHNISAPTMFYNPSVPLCYEMALKYEDGSAITSTGALVAKSGTKTGRSPSDKRIVDEPSTTADVWWGSVNMPIDEHTFDINKVRATDYLSTRPILYVVEAYAGVRQRLKVRIIAERAYHCLFISNMLINLTPEEEADFGEPELTVINGGAFPANRLTTGMSSSTSVNVNLRTMEIVILGTEYAGEMKKSIFSAMHYLMPARDIVSLHSSANEGPNGDVSLFFGLSGTGKTTLSADINRALIGDDEHCWDDQGVFNIEGGCYAKCIDLSPETEPEIFAAIQYGSILENVVYDPYTRVVDYHDTSITLNTRCAYPIDYIPNAKVPSEATHPSNVILLTCDAFGVMPPVAKLTHDQAMYHFVAGYTAKVAGTEVGVTEPKPEFSACFGAPFLIRHPMVYARLLAEKLKKHGAQAWLVNTGWTGGPFGVGSRFKLRYTRAILDAIHEGNLAEVDTTVSPVFGFHVPVEVPGVRTEILSPRSTWEDLDAYDEQLASLGAKFVTNFEQFAEEAGPDVVAAGPSV